MKIDLIKEKSGEEIKQVYYPISIWLIQNILFISIESI